MKKTTIIIAMLAFMLSFSCTNSDQCVTFNPDNVETLKERIDTSLFSPAERIMIGQYLMGYMVMHPKKDMQENPFASMLKSKVEAEGYKECSNLCEVLEHQRQKLKDKGTTEEELVAKFNK